jgi:hypothetical protein
VGKEDATATVIPETVRQLLAGDALGHVVTLDADGTPFVTLAWVGLETGNRNALGLNEYLVLDGSARVTEGGAPEPLQHLAHTYLGPDVVFPAMPDPPSGFVTRMTVERIRGIGPWAAAPG